MPKHGSIQLYVHRSQKARYDGQPRTATSTLTHLLNYGCVGGQLRGEKRVPLQWRNGFWQSLEEGAGKRCSDCVSDALPTAARPKGSFDWRYDNKTERAYEYVVKCAV